MALTRARPHRHLITFWHIVATTRGELPHAVRMHNAVTSKAQDDAAFETFFRRYEPRITGYLYRMLSDSDGAADLCQETFFRAWQHFDTIGSAQQPTSWLFRVATNLALNWLSRKRPLSLDDMTDPAKSDPTGRVIERELVRQTLQELPKKQRALLILRDVYGYNYAEMGELLSMNPDAVKMAISRARKQFRQSYCHV